MRLLTLSFALVAAVAITCQQPFDPFDAIHRPATDSVIVTAGVTPAFFWHGHNARRLEVMEEGTSDMMWSLTAVDSLAGLASPVLYGACPLHGAATPPSPGALVHGRRYVVTTRSTTGALSRTRFSP